MKDITKDKIWLWIASHLPHKLVYWAVICAWAYATTGKYSNNLAPGMAVDIVLARWQMKKVKK